LRVELAGAESTGDFAKKIKKKKPIFKNLKASIVNTKIEGSGSVGVDPARTHFVFEPKKVKIRQKKRKYRQGGIRFHMGP
jgi:hypothetical protein